MRIKHNHALGIKDRPLTAQRQLLLDILREAEGHLDAKEVYRLAIARDRHISLATVYRNLRLFKQLGLVNEIRLDEVNCYYEIRPSNEHYHLLCTGCGRIIEFESPLIAEVTADVERTCGFQVDRAVLHLKGVCEKCRQR